MGGFSPASVLRAMKFAFSFGFVATALAALAVGLFKFHNLTTFHVFTLFFFFIVFFLMYIERQERKYWAKRNRVSKQVRRIFIQRANVLSAGVVWFHLTYSILAKDVYFTRNNQLITNLLSICFVIIAVGASFSRKRFSNGVQEKIMVVYVLLLCFPMNLLQHMEPALVGLRMFLFFLVFNLELYVGKMLRYHTTYKQLVLCSYFTLAVNEWYLVSALPVVLTHFLEIQRQVRRRGGKAYKEAYTQSDEEKSESSSSYFLSSSSDSEVETGVGKLKSTRQKKEKEKDYFSKKNKGTFNSSLFSESTSVGSADFVSSEEIKAFLQSKG